MLRHWPRRFRAPLHAREDRIPVSGFFISCAQHGLMIRQHRPQSVARGRAYCGNAGRETDRTDRCSPILLYPFMNGTPFRLGKAWSVPVFLLAMKQTGQIVLTPLHDVRDRR